MVVLKLRGQVSDIVVCMLFGGDFTNKDISASLVFE
jgi:hypothetical protein